MDADTSRWTGDGTFTPVLLAALDGIDAVTHVRVEDAPASRADAGYNFIANEVYVTFGVDRVEVPVRRFGLLPGRTTVSRPKMTIRELSDRLAAIESVGAPDFADEGMLQFLRTERVVPPYQTRGIKVVELVRVYEARSGALP